MKECELCNNPARMYCESDEASLCWDCDAKVHCANFLVARHSRSLLCHICQLPTPWKASGSKLGPTVSVCLKCVNICDGRRERGGADEEDDEIDGGQDDDDEEEETDDDDGDDDGEEEYEDGEDEDQEAGENQVVPWASTPPPPVTSSSSSDESSSSGRKGSIVESAKPFSLKRLRENADRGCHDDIGCSSSHQNNDTALTATVADVSDDEEATSCGPFRPSKCLKRTETTSSVPPEATAAAAAVVCSLKGFQYDALSGKDVASTILEICKLSKDPSAVDLNHRNRGDLNRLFSPNLNYNTKS